MPRDKQSGQNKVHLLNSMLISICLSGNRFRNILLVVGSSASGGERWGVYLYYNIILALAWDLI